jgi:hypothetical protein
MEDRPMLEITTTPRALLALDPCAVWRSHLETLDPDATLRASDIDNVSALLWAAVRVAPDRARMAVADIAARALPVWERYAPDDDRPRRAIIAARSGDRAAAQAAYATVARAADAVAYTAEAAAYAAYAAAKAAEVAKAAAYAAASRVLIHAAYAASYAATAAAYAADAAANREAERGWQLARLREWLSATPPTPLLV